MPTANCTVYSEVQPEQVWTCLGVQGPVRGGGAAGGQGPVQDGTGWDPAWWDPHPMDRIIEVQTRLKTLPSPLRWRMVKQTKQKE